MNTQINPALYARSRGILGAHGALIGKKLFIPKSEPADLKWNDKVRANELRTNRPIIKYFIEDIEIQSVRLVELPNGGGVVIELNENPKLQFKLTAPKFNKVDITSVKEALEEYKKDTPKPIFFDDGIALQEVIAKLNEYQKDDAVKLAEELLNMSEMFDKLNKQMSDDMSAYYDELGRQTTE